MAEGKGKRKPKVCFILVAGLDQQLLAATPGLQTLAQFAVRRPLRPVLPAVTSTMQATLTTGVLPCRHGIIANGLYTHNRAELQPCLDLTSFPEFRKDVSFWEQSNELLDAPRFWTGSDTRVAMLFWQNSMDGAADVVVTPKPTHSPDGQTLTACWSSPPGLYAELAAALGPFPLMNYWGPLSALPSSQWIIRCAIEVWNRDLADLHLVYLPHLDYNLQRKGPSEPAVIKDLQDLDAALAPLVEAVRASGGIPIVAGDYAMTAVQTAIMPNVAFRAAGLLQTMPDPQGKLLIDFDRTAAFALADHQVAHIYADTNRLPEILKALSGLAGIAKILQTPAELEAAGLCSGRSGDLVALARPDAWFAHDWWLADTEKPAWQFSVDIHRKPGYDPRELFFDPVRRCIAQDPALVKGSHGLVPANPAQWPVLLCDDAIAPRNPTVEATEVAGWLKTLCD